MYRKYFYKICRNDKTARIIGDNIAVVLWFAILESQTRKRNGQNKLKFKKKTIIALLYYRLRNLEYAENTIWSITCELYHLDYCNSDYDPMKDERIIGKLKQFGFEV